MRWQERSQVRHHADWTHAWATTAMRNAECFVQIQMANIGTEIARTTQAYLRVHVSAVHIDLAAAFVNNLAKVSDRFFEHAVGRWIGDHRCREVCRMFFSFSAQIV